MRGAHAQETYTYNNRLQPWMIELGTAGSSGNPSASYCLVYNYFSSWTPPSSCPQPSSVPTSGSGNNGNVMGYWYQDSVQSGLSHTATYSYDGVNRLSTAVATGNSTYNLTFSYDPYGNMTCTTNGQTQGYCPNWTFNSSTNQLTSSGFSYDAAGNLTQDSSNATPHTYQWDAEGRVASVDSGSTWSFTYNALGQRVQWAYAGGADQHLFDPAGGWLGKAGSYSLVRWGGALLVIYTGSETYFHHVNHLSSTTMMTSHAGSAVEDLVFSPWGDVWQSWGGGGYNFAGMPYRDLSTTTDLTAFRVFSPNLGRWHSPDPLAGDITNPQSLNRYAYVRNNPTTFADPKGLDLRSPGDWNDTGCTLDGFDVWCGSLGVGGGGGGGGNGVMQCSNSDCSPIYGTDPYTGTQAWLFFTAGAGGATGYLSGYDWTLGVNEVNGTFLTNAAFQTYLRSNFLDAINAQLNAVIDALEAKGVEQKYITAFVNYESQNFNSIYGPYVEGGNVNFSSSGFDATTNTSFSFGFGCKKGRCDLGALGTLDFSHNNGYFHLDTADPWSSLGSAFLHLVVDVIGGNVVYSVIPR